MKREYKQKGIHKKINRIIKWLESVAWWNCHDTAWIEKTIEKLNKLKE